MALWFGGAGFSLWGVVLARFKTHRLKPAPLALKKLLQSNLSYGFAPGGRKHMGRSRDVRRPAWALRIVGMQFTTTEAVAMSPCVPPGIVSVRLGLPAISTVSPGSVAPTNICNSI